MLRIRAMTAADVPLGLRLCAQTGWNQTEADWRRLLQLAGEGAFVAEWEGARVATTLTCRFGGVAWVAMVLVDESARGRGIGSALMRRAIAFLEEGGVRSIRLDATPLGRPVYEKLGFEVQFPLARYAGEPRLSQADVSCVEPVAAVPLPELIAIDAEATRTDRSPLIARLFAENGQSFRIAEVGGRCVGYVAARPGSNAWQIGPCIAAPRAGRNLLWQAAAPLAGKAVYVDVPCPNAAAAQTCEEIGLRPQRGLLRMCRGAPVVEDVERLWASSGPELG